MRLTAAILVLLGFALMTGAAYLPAGAWQLALYADVIAWTLAALFIIAAVTERLARDRAAWARAGVAVAAAAAALGQSMLAPPGKLGVLPLGHLAASGASIAALGCVGAAAALGWATLRLDRRGPNWLALAAILGALTSLHGWVHT